MSKFTDGSSEMCTIVGHGGRRTRSDPGTGRLSLSGRWAMRLGQSIKRAAVPSPCRGRQSIKGPARVNVGSQAAAMERRYVYNLSPATLSNILRV